MGWVAGDTPFRGLDGAGERRRLKMRALAAFSRFEEVWDFNDFWKRGNTFDACLNLADAMRRQWPGDPEVRNMQKQVGKMSEKNLAFFGQFDPGHLWADDFGWWGLMGLNARDYWLKMENPVWADSYLKLAGSCWENMTRLYDYSPAAKPVAHGCRNGDAEGNNKGVKNTVTNVLLFLLSCRLYRAVRTEDIRDRDKYLDMAYRQWSWFREWIGLKQYEYLKGIPQGGALVQERPVAFFEGSDYADRLHPPWQAGWLWTGDQGMLAAALAEMLMLKNELAAYLDRHDKASGFDTGRFEGEVRNLITRLGRGIKAALTGSKDAIIREAPFFSSFGPNHGNDYLAGRGILMRYAGADQVKKYLGADLTKNIKATAEAIWNTRDRASNQFKPEFTDPAEDRLYIKQFRAWWGLADDVLKWDIGTMNEQEKSGVCQSVGLDALGAVIRSF